MKLYQKWVQINFINYHGKKKQASFIYLKYYCIYFYYCRIHNQLQDNTSADARKLDSIVLLRIGNILLEKRKFLEALEKWELIFNGNVTPCSKSFKPPILIQRKSLQDSDWTQSMLFCIFNIFFEFETSLFIL